MSKIRKSRGSKDVSVRGERRTPTDVRKLSRALLLLAQAQAEKEAQAEHAKHSSSQKSSGDNAVGAA